MNIVKKTALFRGFTLMLLSIVVFVFFGLFAMSFAMSGNHGGEHCPYMADMSSFCGMTALEHRAVWEQLSSAASIFRPIELLAVMTLGAVFVILALAIPSLIGHAPPLPLHLYAQQYPERIRYRNIRELFSAGILHSKAW